MDLQQAKDIANATQWEGDHRVNFKTCHDAARVLAVRVNRYEEALLAIERELGHKEINAGTATLGTFIKQILGEG